MRIFYRDQQNTGTLVALTLQRVRGQANLFFFRDPAPRGATFIPGVVVQSVQYSQETNTQFQASMGRAIYVHSFGDRMGTMQISGLAFPRVCQQAGVNGLKEVFAFYRAKRVAASTATTIQRVKVVFAEEVIIGYLTAMSLTTVDAESGIHQFQLGLYCLPQNLRLSEASTQKLFSPAVLDYTGSVQTTQQQIESAIA